MNPLWIFQDQDNGPYGIYEHTWWGAIKWAIRNPLHNFTHHVIAWPGGPFFKWGSVPGWNGYIGFRPDDGVFGMALRYETTT